MICVNARKISFAPENRQPMLSTVITKQHMYKSYNRKTKIYIIFSLRNGIFNLMNNSIIIENLFLETFMPFFYFIKFIFSHRCLIRCLFNCKVTIFLSSSYSFHPAFCHSRMPEGSSANLSWTRTSTWTVLRVLRRLIGEHEASDPPICLIFQEWKIFKCCRCCFIFYALVRVTVPLVTFL